MTTVALGVVNEPTDLYGAFVDWMVNLEIGSPSYLVGARNLLERFADPQDFADAPLAERTHVRPMINFLMLNGHLHPGYD